MSLNSMLWLLHFRNSEILKIDFQLSERGMSLTSPARRSCESRGTF